MNPPTIAFTGSLSRRIADGLAEAIARGNYPVGVRLPAELALSRLYGASRFTIREALLELRARGLVASRRGSGSVVLRSTPQAPRFGEAYRSIDAFLASVAEMPLVPFKIRDVIADEALAVTLRCEAGRQFLLFHGIRRLIERPEDPAVALVDAYINPTYAALRPYLSMLTESIAGTAEKILGVRVQSIVQELEAIVLNADQALQLTASLGSPAMLVSRWYFLDGEIALLASRSVYPQGRLPFRTELRRERPPDERAGQ